MTRIHLIDTNDFEKDIDFLWSQLREDEQIAADRFVRHRDKVCYVISRAVLRFLLAEELEILPLEISFTQGEKGKPFLSDKMGSQLKFNISHSHQKILIATHPRTEIGVDLECIRRIRKLSSLAKRFFTSFEYAQFEESEDKLLCFFKIWTLKEAIVKLSGGGISGGLNWFDVSTDTDHNMNQLVRSDRVIHSVQNTFLHAIDIGSEYCAAIAIATDSHTWKVSPLSSIPKRSLLGK